jgi:hypothetical protein
LSNRELCLDDGVVRHLNSGTFETIASVAEKPLSLMVPNIKTYGSVLKIVLKLLLGEVCGAVVGTC